ncbi:hypothetical protein Ocin01_00951, partial [Orchesella cincta]
SVSSELSTREQYSGDTSTPPLLRIISISGVLLNLCLCVPTFPNIQQKSIGNFLVSWSCSYSLACFESETTGAATAKLIREALHIQLFPVLSSPIGIGNAVRFVSWNLEPGDGGGAPFLEFSVSNIKCVEEAGGDALNILLMCFEPCTYFYIGITTFWKGELRCIENGNMIGGNGESLTKIGVG